MEAYRSVLEVLKWNDHDTVLHIAEVSRVWSQVCASQELWFSLLDSSHFDPTEVPSLSSAQAIYRHIYSYRKPKRCVLVDNTRVSLYNCTDQSWVRTWECKVLPGNRYCAAVWVNYNEVLFTGGGCRECTLFSVRTGGIRRTTSMVNVRSYHSAVGVGNCVYVFGAYQKPSQKSAEQLCRSTWSGLPDMLSGRYCFNACVKSPCIYLCGGDTAHCEVFNIQSKSFRDLGQDIGPTFLTVSIVLNGDIVTFAKGKVHFHREKPVYTRRYENALIP